MSLDEITDEERRAIASLQRLAKRWPPTLTLYSFSGSLGVFHSADNDRIVDDSASSLEKGDLILDWIRGIPNGGGGP